MAALMLERAGDAPQSGTKLVAAPTVSVVVPNYNHARHLVASIGALLAQRRQPDEIILIDDGSTDDSLAVIRLLAHDEPRIRILVNPVNLGVVASVNIGLREAKGDYIAFAAADDITQPDFLADALASFEKWPQAALFCAEAAVIEQDRPASGESRRPAVRPSAEGRYFSPDETAALLAANDHFIVTLTTVYCRDLLIAAGGFDPELGSTSDGFVARALALRHGFCFLPKVLAHWKVAAAGYSRSTVSDGEAVERLIQASRARIAADPAFPEWYAELFDRRFRFSTCRLALLDDAPNWAFVKRIGAPSALDQAMFSLLRRGPRALTRLASLGWLTLRLRPYALGGLIATAIRRRAEGQRRSENRQ
jgi:glycosyltransferase involved in cell wall biosynthesis